MCTAQLIDMKPNILRISISNQVLVFKLWAYGGTKLAKTREIVSAEQIGKGPSENVIPHLVFPHVSNILFV